jgi:hypothetical protein
MPPVCVKVSLNALLAVPLPLAGLLTVMAGQVMTSVYVAPVPVQRFASVTVTTIGNVPPCVGVPERTPAVDSVRPVGSVLAVV